MKPGIKKRIYNQPFILFLLAAIILFLVSFFLREKIIDIHLHDTMFVISMMQILWALSIILYIGWLVYWIFRNYLLKKYLTWFHVIATLLVFFLFIGICLWPNETPTPETNMASFQRESDWERIFYLAIPLVFIVAQISFIINLLGGLFKNRN